VKELGTYESLQDKYAEIPVTSYPDMLIMPDSLTRTFISPGRNNCRLWRTTSGMVESIHISD